MTLLREAKPKRTVLRYYGGKWKLAQWITEHFPAHRIYVEPFCGACSVLLQKPRAYAELISDMDGEVVNVFRVMRDPVQARELRRLLELTPYARTEFESAFLEHGDPIEQARRTIVKAFMGFGADALAGKYHTGFRNDSNRSGTTPAHDWKNYPAAIDTFTARLRGVVIENRNAFEIIPQHDREDTLFYVDPPYPHDTRNRVRAHGYRFEMTDDDHRELAAALHQVKGMVVLSGYPCPLYDEELFSSWRRVERKAYADGAKERTEVLWLNAAANRGIQERFDF